MKGTSTVKPTESRAGPRFSRLVSSYGMLLVLAALCLFFSWATLDEQQLEGEEAAEAVAETLSAVPGRTLMVTCATRGTDQDRRFHEGLKRLLEGRGGFEVTAVGPEPKHLRAHLRALVDAGSPPDVIATTRSSAPAVERVLARIPELTSVKRVTPPGYTWPTFLLTENLLNVANQIVVIAIMAVGMTMVIITGGIDLSVGSLVAFSAVVTAWLIGVAGGGEASGLAMVACSLAAVALCAGVGGFSGVMVTRFRIPAFIATLAMMQVASGLAYIISAGKPIYEIPDSFVWLGRGTMPILAIPYGVVLMLLLYGAAHIVMARTTLGRYIYAVGGNREAAHLSGVRVNRVLLLVYIASGAMAGLGGVVLASQLKGGAPTYGLMYELYVIACVVVGGTSLAGGEGKMMGTLIGAFTIAVIRNGMNLTSVESYTQKVVLGLVILGAVLLDRLRRL